MTRHDVRQLLSNYAPTNEQELNSKSAMLTFLGAYEDCFERTLEIGHFTASCWLLNKVGDKALLTHHAKLNRWLQLGGHCDGDSNVLRVALKEAQEESGIQHIVPVTQEIFDIDVHLIPENKKEKAHYHYDIRFLLQVARDEEVIVSDESHALQWISKQSIDLPMMDASVMRMFNKWVERQ